MKLRAPLFGTVFASMVVALFLPLTSDGFNDAAHRNLSRRAVDPSLSNASVLHSYLISTLGFEFSLGVNQLVTGGQRVVDLIADGAVNEDYPLNRVLNHFHDPTKAWNSAGLKSVFSSSVVWSQNSNQGLLYGGNRAWHQAREAFYFALTASSQSDRKRWYATTFKLVGNAIHHVQDAAVPSHTRDDAHFAPSSLSKLPDGDPFHYWADTAAGAARINASQPLRFGASLLSQTSPNQFAPIPFARISDSTDGNIGSLALVPGLSLGLAEYSNANFISKGTALSTTYQSPRLSQMQFGVETVAGGKRVRYAKFLPGIGEQDYRIGVASRMVLFANGTNVPDALDFGLDDNVHDDYGTKLFPRAIGYSAGLIDYFFRGQVDSRWTTPALHFPAGFPPTSISLDGVKLLVSGEAQPTGSGTMRLVLLHYHTFRGTDPGPLSPGPHPAVVVSDEAPFTNGLNPQRVTFQFSSLPFPASYPSQGCCYGSLYMGMIVYRGSLGQESSNAIVASGYCVDPESGEKWERYYSLERSSDASYYIGEC